MQEVTKISKLPVFSWWLLIMFNLVKTKFMLCDPLIHGAYCHCHPLTIEIHDAREEVARLTMAAVRQSAVAVSSQYQTHQEHSSVP